MRKVKSISLVVCIIVLLFLVNTSNAIQYEIINLGLGIDVGVRDINNNGQIVGSFNDNETGLHNAFIYDNGVMTNLGTLGGDTSFAYGINDSGQIVGYSEISSGYQHAFLYENGAMNDLGTLGEVRSGGLESKAYDINNSGQIVGRSGISDNGLDIGINHAFLYEDGIMTDLEPDHVNHPGSYAWGINNNGQIVGTVYGRFGSYPHGYLYDGSWQDLGQDKFPHAINDSGQIVGTSPAGSFLYENGALQYIGTLGGQMSNAVDINESGQIVGSSQYDAPSIYSHAFIYDNGIMTDLGTLGGNKLASAINDHGQIVGYATTSTGERHAVIWNPVTVVAEPISSILFITGGTLLAGRRYFRRKTI